MARTDRPDAARDGVPPAGSGKAPRPGSRPRSRHHSERSGGPGPLPPFAQAVDDHGPVVLRVCSAVAGPADAEDAWSETFLAALRAYGDLRPDSDLRAWLVTIAYRKSLDAVRRARRRPVPRGAVPDHPVPTPAPGPAWELPSGPLGDALAGLAPKQRLAVAARYLADLSYTEVAAVLGTTEAAARRNAADGIGALRRRSSVTPAAGRHGEAR